MAHVRAYLPGTRLVGGRFVRLRTDLPLDASDPWGTLADPTKIRGVFIPAGSRIACNIDSDDIEVVLAARTRVRGIDVPKGSTLEFPGRVTGFPGLRLTPLLLLAMPVLWLRNRLQARNVTVTTPDGSRFVVPP
jgi:hypothetical protein